MFPQLSFPLVFVSLSPQLGHLLHVGGVVFRACTINDDRQRDWFSCVWDGTHGHSTPPRLVNISGDVTIHNPALQSCHADFGNPSLGLSPDITVEVDCNPA